jgi:predicted DNA-binding antitoxin AbrB/MazE fold protein
MVISTKAIYENGVLRPLDKLDLPERREVQITIKPVASEDLLTRFTQHLQGKDINQSIHEAKADSESRILGQGVAYIALFISDMMMEAVTTVNQGASVPEERKR